MPVFLLPPTPVFPDPVHSEPDGLLAVGGDLTPERLLAAYSQGIFPWYNEDSPILWWSPDPRPIIEPSRLHISRSLRRVLNKNLFRVTFDHAFSQVIRSCAGARRPEGDGTWLLDEMIEAYTRLHELGFAHSAEAWAGDRLVGGIYGVALGRAFFAESMFYRQSNASKVAMVMLVQKLEQKNFHFMDCQQSTPHAMRFGAREISRNEFLDRLARALHYPSKRNNWKEESQCEDLCL